MVILKNFNGFGATHWETGSLSHALTYQNKPVSEAMMLGISGGVTFGYFTFAYEGYDPHVALLTRNTFDPFERMCERLGVTQEIRQTPNPDKAFKTLGAALEEGKAVIAYVDLVTLPHNHLKLDEGMWVMMPVVVYGLDGERVYLSDRSKVSLEIDRQTFAAAWGRTKANKHKLLTVDLETLDKLPRAVEKGINDCISLFTEAPPKGAKHNFGFAALDYWAEMLVKDKAKTGWTQLFPAGRALLNGLITAYSGIEIFGTGGSASRNVYADFLDEAVDVLGKPALSQAGALFRESSTAWSQLGCALLPDSIPAFRELREVMLMQEQRFIESGDPAPQLMERLNGLRAQVIKDFPFNDAEYRTLREQIREAVLVVRAAEREAVNALEAAMS